MENFLLKLRLIFWPFVRLVLLVASGYAVLWAGLVWGLGATLGVQLRTGIGTQFFLLGTVGGIATLVGLRPRLHLLPDGPRGGWRSLFYYLATITIGVAAGTAAAAAAAQASLLQLVMLRDASEVPRHPANTAYVLQHAYLARRHTTFEDEYGSIKGGSRLTIYAATPVFRTAADTAGGAALGWLADAFITTSNTRDYSNTDFTRFRQETTVAARVSGPESFTYLVTAEPSPGLLAAVARSPWAVRSATRPILLEARYRPFAQRSDDALHALRLALLWGGGLFLGFLLFPKVNERRLQHYRGTGRFATDDEYVNQALAWLRPRPGFFATPLLLGLHGAALLVLVVAGLGFFEVETADLLAWGASSGPGVRGGQWWRLLVSPLLTDGILSWLNSAWALVFAGRALEPVVGRRGLVGVYAAAALAGGLASVWGQPASLAVGASGAVMGLFGLGIALAIPARAGGAAFRLEVFATLAGLFVFVHLLLGLATERLNVAVLMGGLLAGGLLSRCFKGRASRPPQP
ncbi:rhomboid family intramembrane serine protease [Hymenobacter sp. M29]|uniref:Rhomboid family intramembrane serine protease n=1 Tax=Hymenobacter mellowenesis TaxID=3063995 RepID=A0ABT9A9S5_9BACT|nr:rhomboid family intramembrane serine protease [Hymenobacter sp. M29]MDO7846596.1 rhomboid family intramembrane serine protease [Hymenobacter sp. M29]